jgi:hypothetical protein
MAVKLHRCGATFVKVDGHPCWKALNEAGVDYEIVKEPYRPGKRTEVEEKTGQKALPVVELEDGRWIREDSKDLAARIKEGRLRA